MELFAALFRLNLGIWASSFLTNLGVSVHFSVISSQLASTSSSKHAEIVITEYLIYNESMLKSDVDFVSLENKGVLKKKNL